MNYLKKPLIIMFLIFIIYSNNINASDKLVVPVVLDDISSLNSKDTIYVIVESKILNIYDSQPAIFNHINNTFISVFLLPVGIFNYYFIDEKNNYYINKNEPFLVEEEVKKNTLIVNQRFFSKKVEKTNYIADDFIILKDYYNLILLTLKNDCEEVNLYFKLEVEIFFDTIEMLFEYPMTLKKSEDIFDYYIFEEEYSHFKPFEFCFTVRSGKYKFFIDKDGLKLNDTNLHLFKMTSTDY